MQEEFEPSWRTALKRFAEERGRAPDLKNTEVDQPVFLAMLEREIRSTIMSSLAPRVQEAARRIQLIRLGAVEG